MHEDGLQTVVIVSHPNDDRYSPSNLVRTHFGSLVVSVVYNYHGFSFR